MFFFLIFMKKSVYIYVKFRLLYMLLDVREDVPIGTEVKDPDANNCIIVGFRDHLLR